MCLLAAYSHERETLSGGILSLQRDPSPICGHGVCVQGMGLYIEVTFHLYGPVVGMLFTL